MSFTTPTDRERHLATLLHLCTYLEYAVPILGILAPLAIWLIAREKSRYVDTQGWEWANFTLFTLICGFVWVIGVVCATLIATAALGPHAEPTFPVIVAFGLTLGIPGMLLLAFTVAQPMIAAYNCSRGLNFRYPLPFRILKK